MGGFGSGRYGRSPAVESGLQLDINELLRQRIIAPEKHNSGTLRWSNAATGEEVASIGFDASLLDQDDAWARLHYTANGARQDYRVLIANSPCNYGGLRWWWECPRSGRRVGKLYL